MYRSLNNYLKEKFGCKVYKLAISGGMTCPNRDGTLSTDGCIFCSESGSGDFSEKHCNSVTEQIEKAKLKVAKKTKCDKYIAYFQDFTNTYAPIGYLKKIFTEAISHPDIAALSIATRPDCLPNEVLDLLNQLQKIKIDQNRCVAVIANAIVIGIRMFTGIGGRDDFLILTAGKEQRKQ